MTDNSSDTPNGVETGVGEPSMEDILASIRRIIAEDDDNDQGHLDVGPGIGSFTETVSEVLVEPVVETAEASSDASEDVLILDQLVNVAGLEDSELSDVETEELVLPTDDAEDFNPVSSVVSDLEDRLADDRSSDDISLELDDDDIVFSSDGIENMQPKPSDTLVLNNATDDSSATDEIDDLMNISVESLGEDSDPVEALDLDMAEDLSDVGADLELEAPSVEEDAESDLDIVKSLMADLADTSFLDEDSEAVAEAALSEDLEIPAIDETLTEDLVSNEVEDLSIDLDEALDLVVEDEPVAVAEETETDEILNDILELAIQDEETVLSDLDLAVDEDLIIPEPGPDAVDDGNSLLQIAAEAEADADAMDGSTGLAASAGAAIAATAAVLNGSDDSDDEIEIEIPVEDMPSTEDLLSELDLALAEVSQDDIQEEAAPDPAPEPEPEIELVVDAEAESTELFVEPEETEEMARTARKDAIINEVTEDATADAFAELSQAVEDKAVFTESGPRIGDIVQDALRPMLKEWLDDNLKSIVERAVAKEVKRISSGK